jgi:proteasome lid subunit RPN8/RPN11
MFDNLKRWLGKQPKYKQGKKIGPRIVISASCIDELKNCMATEINIGHEGVAYLLGQTDGNTTLVVSAVRPQSTSTPGSFHVSSVAMAEVVRLAVEYGLETVGQVHTHPGLAYHSEGDEDGALIAYGGFVSMVLPNYGSGLPSLKGAAVFMYEKERGFIPIDSSFVNIVPARLK